MRLGQMKRTVLRHLMMRNYPAYEQVLKAIRTQGDIWMTSQGEYIVWWQKRKNATLRVVVADGVCTVDSCLEDAVFEKFPGEFLDSFTVQCEKTGFSGEVWITIDTNLEKQDLLIELLRREGILNFRVAKEGEFLLSQENLGELLEEIDVKLRERGRLFEADIAAVRRVVIGELAERGLPLLRIWYHPRINGTIVRAVFSPRHDVDRAINSVARVRRLEQKYGVTSTTYLRAFCPFYSDRDIRALASSGWCTEIGLHGEFVPDSRRFGDEYSAAKAEKEHLERLVGRPVVGLCMHGGELISDYCSEDTPEAVERAGFLYDTTSGMGYYFPARPVLNGRMGSVYRLCHAFGDIKVPPRRHYVRDFYEKVMGRMDKVYEQNGVFVLVLHPVYFGFFAYLFQFKNLVRLARFFWTSLKR